MGYSLKQASTLIIDDFQSMRTMLREFVKNMGVVNIDTASNGKDALNQLSNNKYDIVICDYNLGTGPNGQQVLEDAKLRSLIGVSTIWVMVTAEKTSDMVMGAAEVKPDDYLLKPINQVTLQARLEKLMARKQSLGPVEAAIRASDFAVAIGHCDELLKSQVLNPQEVLRIKSDLLLTLGDYAAARTLFEAVLAQRQVAWASTGLAKVLFFGKSYADAIALLTRVLADNPMYVEAADWLAKCYEACGDAAQAQEVLQHAVKLSPNSPVRQKKLGDVAYRNGVLDVAQSAFEKTIRISEFSPHKSAAVYARLADVFSDKGESQEALNVLKRTRSEFRFNSAASLQTATAEARVYHKMGKADLSQASLATAESLMAQMEGKLTAEQLMDVAQSHLQLGHQDKACKILADIVKNNHEDTDISAQIEHIFAKADLKSVGQALINASRQEVVDINNQGVVLAKKGDYQQGAGLLRSAIKQLPGSEVMIVNLAGLLIAQMSKDGYKDVLAAEARELLERVHGLNPANKKYYSYTLVLTRLQRNR